MLAALVRVMRLIVSVPVLEFAGAVLVVAGVWTLAGGGWAFVAAGVLCLLKALDLSLEER